jgi:hypothetical protein
MMKEVTILDKRFKEFIPEGNSETDKGNGS